MRGMVGLKYYVDFSPLTVNDETGRLKMADVLAKRAVGFWGLVFYSLGTVLPFGIFGLAAIAIRTFTPNAVVDFVFGFLVTLLAASVVYQFSKKITHAGGYYAFVAAGLGRKTGLISGWLYAAYLIMTLATGAASIGFLVSVFTHYFFNYVTPLFVVYVLDISVCLLMYLVTYYGVQVTTKAAVVVGGLEIISIIAISTAVIVLLGKGNTVAAIAPPSISGLHAFFLGFIVGSFESYAGYGGMLTLSEEAKLPKELVRKALVVTISLAALSFVLGTYVVEAGWGLQNLKTLVALTAPGYTVVGKWLGLGVATYVLLLLLAAQYLSPMMAGSSGSRVLYALARDGSLPSFFGHLNAKKAPSRAALFTMIAGIILIIVFTQPMVAVYGYTDGIFFAVIVMAIMLTILSMVIHILSGISMPLYFSRAKKEFSIMLHGVVPIVTIIVFLIALYYSLNGIGMPFVLAPIFVLIFSVIGIIYIFVKERSAPSVEMKLDYESE